MTLQTFISKLISADEATAIIGKKKSAEPSVEIGTLVSYAPAMVQRFFEVWCPRVDKIIAIDKETNGGTPSWRGHTASRHRGFTMSEFRSLFNSYIAPQEYPFYPVYGQVNQAKGGINTEKQKADILALYECTEQQYVQLLCEHGFEPLLKAFFGQHNALDALLPLNMLRRHTYICSATGTGKSELMRYLFRNMVAAYPDASFIMLDPHGSLAEDCKLLKGIGGDADRLVYIDPFLEEGYTPSFNPFRLTDKSLKMVTYVAEQVITSIEETLSRNGGELTEIQMNLLEKCIYFLLSRPNSTILDLERLLDGEDAIFAEANAYNPQFFNAYFKKPNNKTREGVQYRIGRLLNSPILRHLIGGKASFDIEQIINQRKVLLVNLGGLPDMTQMMFGKFLLANIKSIIRKRKKSAPSNVNVFLLIDEAHTIVTETNAFEHILSQLRGYGLSSTVATQYLAQLGDHAMSVERNTAIKILGGEMNKNKELKRMAGIDYDIQLNDYEFVLKVFGQTPVVFKSSDELIRNKAKYEISEAEEYALHQIQLERYYKPIEDENTISDLAPSVSPQTPPNQAPQPPFDLNIADE